MKKEYKKGMKSNSNLVCSILFLEVAELRLHFILYLHTIYSSVFSNFFELLLIFMVIIFFPDIRIYSLCNLADVNFYADAPQMRMRIFSIW